MFKEIFSNVHDAQVCQLFSCYVSPSINKVLIIIIIMQIRDHLFQQHPSLNVYVDMS